mmetsp:Transcript_421/g.956  ORF Transcript_421/g.956 Transcript_421/m.956 type:complete len:469 (+) Transcript_421:27-1433(+)
MLQEPKELISEFRHSRNLLRHTVEGVQDFRGVFDGFERVAVGGPDLLTIEDDQDAHSLIQSAVQFTVQNHLAKLGLGARQGQLYQLGYVLDLDAAEGFQYSQNVLLQQGLVEIVQMVGNDGVLIDLGLELAADLLEFLQIPLCEGCSDGSHGINAWTGVLQTALAAQDRRSLLGTILHDLGQEHVFHGGCSLGRRLAGVEGLECLVEVRERGSVVLLPGGNDSRPQVNLGLCQWRAVNGVGVGLGGRESRLGLRDVLHGVVCTTFEQVNVDEKKLVVEFFDLQQQTLQDLYGRGVLLILFVETRQAALDTLSKEGSLLMLTPLDAVPAHVDLQVQRIWRFSQGIDQYLHDLGGLGLRQFGEHGSELLGEFTESVALSSLDVEIAEGIDCLLASLRTGVLQLLVEDDLFVGLGGILRRLRLDVLRFLEKVIKRLAVESLLVNLHRFSTGINLHSGHFVACQEPIKMGAL